ncbi:MAG TPA: hypothetical protein PKI93_04925 [Alphaproteobacteria bacterium]|nr:hypothetical protein [Alphaproteobacteria bacterium]HNS45103.1 hypothetical protein [Alphaproteobacteria bacterium]
MTKLLSLAVCGVLMLGGFAAYAEDVKDDHAERMALSRELHDIKKVKEQVLGDIDNIAQSLPMNEREDFKKYMELHVDFDALEQKSIEYAADTYTIHEFKAMIAYFGSNEGRSAEAKGGEYAAKFGPEVQKEIDKAIMAAKFDKIGGSSHPEPTKDMLGK